MSYFHCGNGYPDRCNGYKGPLDASVCTSDRHKYDECGRQMADFAESLEQMRRGEGRILIPRPDPDA